MSLVVAVDGPSDSGKSTLIAGLSRHFAGEDPVVMPCYVDQASGSDVPEFTTDVDEQMEAVDFYLGLETERARSLAGIDGPKKLIILDRSVYTLVAHSYAVEQLHGAAVYERCKAKVATEAEVIIPEIVLYLDAGVEERDTRADPQDRNKWFTDPRFNDEIRIFFLKRFPACGAASELHVLDASRPATAVLSDAVAIVTSNLR